MEKCYSEEQRTERNEKDKQTTITTTKKNNKQHNLNIGERTIGCQNGSLSFSGLYCFRWYYFDNISSFCARLLSQFTCLCQLLLQSLRVLTKSLHVYVLELPPGMGGPPQCYETCGNILYLCSHFSQNQWTLHRIISCFTVEVLDFYHRLRIPWGWSHNFFSL